MSFGARCACDAGLEGDVKGLYRFGIEEEYFLADAGTRDTPSGDALERFHAAAQGRHSRVEREMLASQVEGSTPPFTDFAAARDVLSDLRSGLAATAQEHGLLVFAAGTHPVARWLRQNPTSAKRYEDLARELGQPARRNVVGGLHVHVEVPRPEQRVDHMNRLLPYLPLLLSLSASSPLWQGVPTGLAAYRLSVFGEMPRSGLPEFFSGIEEYERFLDIMISSKAIPDASYLWWYVRPALRYPTLELRVTDSCTYLEDALAIAALWRCLVRLVDRRPDINSGLTGVSRAIVAENLWRAQRDGVRAHLIDEATGQTAPVRQRLAEVIADVEEDAHALGCRKEMEGALLIAERGTSADQQM
ncbi:MAG TPA: carboxylate-amine ligase, partial [Acetobacteraceae bacterium]|nr:carboxylate-amine ligase [Acetobacteraceae bacterium]